MGSRSAPRHSAAVGGPARPSPRYQRCASSRPTMKRSSQAAPGCSSLSNTKRLSTGIVLWNCGQQSAPQQVLGFGCEYLIETSLAHRRAGHERVERCPELLAVAVLLHPDLLPRAGDREMRSGTQAPREGRGRRRRDNLVLPPRDQQQRLAPPARLSPVGGLADPP